MLISCCFSLLASFYDIHGHWLTSFRRYWKLVEVNGFSEASCIIFLALLSFSESYLVRGDLQLHQPYFSFVSASDKFAFEVSGYL